MALLGAQVELWRLESRTEGRGRSSAVRTFAVALVRRVVVGVAVVDIDLQQLLRPALVVKALRP